MKAGPKLNKIEVIEEGVRHEKEKEVDHSDNHNDIAWQLNEDDFRWKFHENRVIFVESSTKEDDFCWKLYESLSKVCNSLQY